jgi:multiple sugar transport system substrate-binding protein
MYVSEKKDVSRRNFVKYAAAGIVVAGVAGAAGYYAATSQPPSPAVTETLTQVMTQTAAATTPVKPPAAKPGQLDHFQWFFGPEFVKKSLDKFTADTGIKTEQHVGPRVGYESSMITKIMGGAPIDTMSVGIGYRDAWYNAGWLENLEGLPGADQAKKEMFPSVMDFYLKDGELIAMPYYMAGWFPFYNKRMVNELGFEPARDRNEVYEQCKAAKKKWNLPAPYFTCLLEAAEWIWEQYIVELGLLPFSKDNKPMFEGDPRNAEALKWMKTMFDEKLMPSSIFTDGWDVLSLNPAKGYTMYEDAHQYCLEPVNRSMTGDVPERGNWYLVPRPLGGNEAKLVTQGEWTAMCKNTHSKEWAWELLKYLTWKDPSGKFQLLREWGVVGLLEPYAEWFNDPEVKKEFDAWNPGTGFDGYKEYFDRYMMVPYWQLKPWFAEFSEIGKETITKYVLGQTSLADLEKTMGDKAREVIAESA